MKKLLFFYLLFLSKTVVSQTDSLKKWHFTGYAELYYGRDLNQPQSVKKPPYQYNHASLNTLDFNLAMGKIAYQNNLIKANVGLMAGNYVTNNLANEPNWCKYIYEATIGIKLQNQNSLWLEAGIFPSHIGFETAISAQCKTVTRSMLAENSPYYESGFKLSGQSINKKWIYSLLLLNGWQQINVVSPFSLTGGGLQLTYTPNSELLFNYSNYIGSVITNNGIGFRHFHNLYLNKQFNNKTHITLGFDIGFDKLTNKKTSNFLSPVIIIQRSMSAKTKMAFRAETYRDKQNTMISANAVYGFSLNIDYQLFSLAALRFETKWLKNNGLANNKQLTQLLSTATLHFYLP